MLQMDQKIIWFDAPRNCQTSAFHMESLLRRVKKTPLLTPMIARMRWWTRWWRRWWRQGIEETTQIIPWTYVEHEKLPTVWTVWLHFIVLCHYAIPSMHKKWWLWKEFFNFRTCLQFPLYQSPFHFLTAISPPVGHTAGDTDVAFQEEIGYMQNFSWKVSKHIAAICTSINGYSILIVLILRLLLVVNF